MSNTQSRKWQLTINNPQEHDIARDGLIEKLKLFHPSYFCMADEIGESGTYHTHVYIVATSPIRFTTLKNRFPMAHIEKAFGTSHQNKDYILKQGVWADDKKAETSVEGTFFEYGEMPVEKKNRNDKMQEVINYIQDGKRTSEIVLDNPDLAFSIREIDTLQQTLKRDNMNKNFRDVEVTYLYGKTGVGKTHMIYHSHNPQDVCRITSYRKNGVVFDGYTDEDILVFEEFHSQIEIAEMLSYLDIYPLRLPARYNDRTAMYTKVYIVSNLALEEQYVNVQKRSPEVWRAFLRRINRIIELTEDGELIEYKGENKNEQ